MKSAIAQSIIALSRVVAVGVILSARVTIDVGDENDNAPQFESSVYRLKVMEDESVGYELIRVKAVGGDEGETIDYRLEAADGIEKYFSLDSKTGSSCFLIASWQVKALLYKCKRITRR